jgi:LysR family hydrogen peroxide-inducible transcriptional activator
MVTITQLEYILAVAKYGHFSKAAEECHITQPTLSQQIQKLEADLNLVLFDRSKKPILLTDAGKKLIQQAQIILSEVHKFESLAKHQPNEISGELSLAVIPTLAPYILPLFLKKMVTAYPDLKLQIREMQTERILAALENDELDVGLLATPLNAPQMLEYPLFYEPFHLFVSQDHPLAKKTKIKQSDLKFDDIWLLTEGHCLRSQVLELCSLPKERKEKKQLDFESGSIETLERLVVTNGGYTLIPELALSTSQSFKHIRIKEFERPIPSRQVGLIYRRHQYKLPLIEALGENIIASLPEKIRKLRPKDLEVLEVVQ